MRRVLMAMVVVIAVVGWTVSAMAAHHAVKVAAKEGIGNYLTDTKGMTLYWFKKDSPDKSACEGPCIDKWPIYYREEAIVPPPGVKPDDFGVITRADGKKQNTFRGYPLYYWSQDKATGDTNGHKVNDVWFVVDPANFPPK
jgi:predicted lipoprotein with Yx(FWY)xxD motif